MPKNVLLCTIFMRRPSCNVAGLDTDGSAVLSRVFKHDTLIVTLRKQEKLANYFQFFTCTHTLHIINAIQISLLFFTNHHNLTS